MIENKYNAIICDLGNVLIDFDHNIAAKKIMACTPKKEKDIYDLFFDSPITKLYEEGKISPDEFFRKVKDSLKLDMDYNNFLPIWNEIFFETPINIKMHNFLKRVKARYKLIMLSNLNKTHFEFLNKKMGIFGEFDRLILSYEVGFRKPAPQIYKAAMDSVKTVPSRAFYIDDRRDLIEAASKLGIKGIAFDGEQAFEEIVKELEG
ncbi:HAD family hydrolase [Candidatus Omnitrophota bacterium]